MISEDTVDYLSSIFEGTEGDVHFLGDRGNYTGRDLDSIEALLDHDPTVCVSLYTQNKELIGLGAVDMQNGPEPTVLLMKGSTKVMLWLFEKPLTDADDIKRASALFNIESEDALKEETWPIDGIGGWKVEEVGRRYKLIELEGFFLPAQASDDWALNDAVVRGSWDEYLLNRDITIAISPNGMKTKPGTWKNLTMKFGALVGMLSHHRSGEKDGQCILQGEVIDGERKATAIRQTSLLMLDLDTGENIEAIREKVRQFGWFTIIWTTFNHLKGVTEVRKDQIIRHMGREEEPSLKDVVGYLRDVRRYQPWVLENSELLEPAHTKEGVMLRLKHAPMPKYRLLFILKEPFVFATRAVNPKKAVEEWKSRYAGVSEMLGAAFDRSCVDPSRLMFTPRHPGGAKGWQIEVIPGQALDIDTVTPVDPKRMKVMEGGDAFDRAAAEIGGVSGEIKTTWLKRWLAINADNFEAEEFWREYGEERKPRANDVGNHFKCPNDGNHSNPDDPEDNAFFVVSGPDNKEGNGFTAVCMHDSCRGIDRGQMLDLFCEELGLNERDLDPFIANPVDANPGREVAEGEDAEEYASLNAYPASTQRRLKDFNRKYGVINIGAEIRILAEPEHADEGPRLYRVDAWKTMEQNQKAQVFTQNNETKTEYLTKVWLEWPDRRNFKGGLCFEPNEKKQRRNQYNLWRGYPTKPKVGDWSLLREHLFENICGGNEEYFNWAMTWLAHMFQYPGEKIGSAFVVRGQKGTGKSKLFDWVRQAMGQHAIKVSQSSHVVGNFNAHQKGVILMCCEEAFWAGSPAAGGVIKDLITSNVMMLEQKGVDAVPTSNYARLAFVSNEDWVVPAGVEDERRFFVLECGNKRQRDTIFFAAVDEQMEEGGVNAMVKEFMEWQPPGGDWNILRNPPRTEALSAQAIESLDPYDQFFIRVIEDGGIDGTEHPSIPEIRLSEDDDNYISVKTLRMHLEKALSGISYARQKVNNPRFMPKLVRRWFGAEEKSVLRRNGLGEQERHYKCLPLSEIRNKLNDLGISIDVAVDEDAI